MEPHKFRPSSEVKGQLKRLQQAIEMISNTNMENDSDTDESFSLDELDSGYVASQKNKSFTKILNQTDFAKATCSVKSPSDTFMDSEDPFPLPLLLQPVRNEVLSLEINDSSISLSSKRETSLLPSPTVNQKPKFSCPLTKPLEFETKIRKFRLCDALDSNKNYCVRRGDYIICDTSETTGGRLKK